MDSMPSDQRASHLVPRRPHTPQMSTSFSRLASLPTNPLACRRASTLEAGTSVSTLGSEMNTSFTHYDSLEHRDIFDEGSPTSAAEGSFRDVSDVDSPQDVPAGFEELPIELISFIDRFIESLSAKVHNTPPSIEKLSDIFQEFYLKAASHVLTHIKALSTRQSRRVSPNSSTSSKKSIIVKDGQRMRSSSSKDTLGSFEQQMLTPQEISNRRRSRRLLERKGIALEEAVERRVCELVHGHLWRHASALDEVRDEKLRSRTAALALVGISLQDLGISFGHQPSETENLQIEGWISKARHGLIMMNDAKHPSGKLQQLKGAHKAIVEFLSEFHQSSSSADEILPTLIYTLITSPPEGINVVSNLNYIQRFRAASRVDGEAAYCLTNLEAAITFLETVDLASLRSEESLEGPPKSSSRPSTPSPMRDLAEQPTLDHPLQTPNLPKVSQPTSPTHQRKLSNPFQPPTTALGAANDAVRTTADQGFKTIGNTLDNSFKLLFGRLKEQKVVREGADANGTSILPKTLDDVARLIDEGYKVDDEDESNVPSTCGPLSDQVDEYNAGSVKADKSLNTAFAGRSRDRSVDSVQSGGSGTRVVFANTSTSDGGRLTESHATAQVMSNQDRSLQHLGNSTVDSMRNFGNSLNPLKGFGGLSVMRGFGRSPSSGTPTLSTSEKPPQEPQHGPTDNKDSTNVKVTFPKTLRPPVQRYLDVKSAEDLRIGEVAELVNDYRRLADALKEFGAFQ